MIDFNELNQQWPHKGIGKNHDLCKAVGVKTYPKVLDATAGLARDAFILAKLGCEVTMLERHPTIIPFIEQALTVFTDDEVRQRMHFYACDALVFLKDCELFDVVYLDPMFPLDNRTALAKKEMQQLQTIVGHDEDSEQLLDLARKKAKQRVVVKRHKLAPCLANQKPNFSIQGKSTRYDVYLQTALI